MQELPACPPRQHRFCTKWPPDWQSHKNAATRIQSNPELLWLLSWAILMKGCVLCCQWLNPSGFWSVDCPEGMSQLKSWGHIMFWLFSFFLPDFIFHCVSILFVSIWQPHLLEWLGIFQLFGVRKPKMFWTNPTYSIPASLFGASSALISALAIHGFCCALMLWWKALEPLQTNPGYQLLWKH